MQEIEEINRKKQKHKNLLRLPIRLVMVYLGFSILLYAYGPFAWVTYEPIKFYSLLCCYMLMLWFGYRFGIQTPQISSVSWDEDKDRKLIRVLQPMILINLLVIIINIMRDYGFSRFNLAALFREIFVNTKNLGLGYNLYQERILTLTGGMVLGGTAMTLFNYVWDFVGFGILLLSLHYFKRLKLSFKLATSLSIGIILLFYISIGTNIGVFRILLAGPCCLCTKYTK